MAQWYICLPSMFQMKVGALPSLYLFVSMTIRMGYLIVFFYGFSINKKT